MHIANYIYEFIEGALYGLFPISAIHLLISYFCYLDIRSNRYSSFYSGFKGTIVTFIPLISMYFACNKLLKELKVCQIACKCGFFITLAVGIVWIFFFAIRSVGND